MNKNKKKSNGMKYKSIANKSVRSSNNRKEKSKPSSRNYHH